MSQDSAHRELVILTGSTGFIGSAIVRRFTDDFRIVGLAHGEPRHEEPGVEYLYFDITEDFSVKHALEDVRQRYGNRIAAVIHLAAYYDFSGEPSPNYDEITVRGTERLLRELQRFQVEQFSFSSTMLVHASCQPGERINEDWPLNPRWPYPESKVATEQLIRAERGPIPVVLLRIAGVYDDRCHSIPLAHQIQRIYERKLISHVFPGDTSHGQAFVHVDDLAEAFYQLVRRRAVVPAELTLIIGEDETLSHEELQRTFGRLIHNEEWETGEIPKALAKSGAWLREELPGKDPFIKPFMVDLADDHYALDTTRARTLLKWQPRHSLRATLPRMVDALEADPARWYREHHLEFPAELETPKLQEHREQPDTTLQHSAGAGATSEHDEMMRAQKQRLAWTWFANIALGIWLLFSAITLRYDDLTLAASDAVSGAIVVAAGVLALWRAGDFWGRWAICFIGIWLLFAPLVFWAPTAAAYANDTLVGSLLIAFSVLAPMMPGRAHHMTMMQPGPDIPPGWSYNPSSWYQRAPVIALGFVSFVIARHMAAYQLGHVDSVWEPFFEPGTAAILTSDVSRAFPISDAGLGAVAYLIEALSGLMGNKQRWRTMPWMVLMFGVLVIPLGVTSIVLVILQPVAVGAWSTPALLTALLMLLMVPLALDEVVAMVQFLVQARREGQPLWRTFWVGGTLKQYQQQAEEANGSEASEYTCPMHSEVRSAEAGRCPECDMALEPRRASGVVGADQRSPRFGDPSARMVPAMVWGVSLPWTLLASAALGLWLMAAPVVLGSSGAAADSDFLVGPLVATFAVIAMAEVGRPLRFVNVALGLWLIAAPWLLDGASSAGTWNDVIAGTAIVVLSLRRGPIRERYGSWHRFIV